MSLLHKEEEGRRRAPPPPLETFVFGTESRREEERRRWMRQNKHLGQRGKEGLISSFIRSRGGSVKVRRDFPEISLGRRFSPVLAHLTLLFMDTLFDILF